MAGQGRHAVQGLAGVDQGLAERVPKERGRCRRIDAGHAAACGPGPVHGPGGQGAAGRAREDGGVLAGAAQSLHLAPHPQGPPGCGIQRHLAIAVRLAPLDDDQARVGRQADAGPGQEARLGEAQARVREHHDQHRVQMVAPGGRIQAGKLLPVQRLRTQQHLRDQAQVPGRSAFERALARGPAERGPQGGQPAVGGARLIALVQPGAERRELHGRYTIEVGSRALLCRAPAREAPEVLAVVRQGGGRGGTLAPEVQEVGDEGLPCYGHTS